MSKVFEIRSRLRPEPVVVPDGQWVAEMQTHMHYVTRPDLTREHGESTVDRRDFVQKIIGGDGSAKEYLMDRRESDTIGGFHRRCDLLAVSPVPFGIVETFFIGREEHEQWHRRFWSARQIHKGELGQKPLLPKTPEFFRTPWKARSDIIGGGSQVRGWSSWTWLSQVAQIVGMEPYEVLHNFFWFSKTHRIGPDPMLTLDTAEFRAGAALPWETITQQTINSDSVRVHAGYEVFCVPASWAMTVLYLHHFGWKG